MAGAVVDPKDLGLEPKGTVSVGPAPTNIVDPADLGPSTPAPALNISSAQAAPATGNSFYNQIARQVGLTGRGIVQGVTDLPLVLNDLALKYVQNPIVEKLGLKDTNIPYIGPLYANRGTMEVRDQLLDQVLPKPLNTTEEIANQGVRAMSSVIPSVGAANTIAKTATSPVTREVATQFAANPGVQAVAAGSGAMTAETARQNFDVQNPLALMGLSMLGSVGGGAAASRFGNVNTAFRIPGTNFEVPNINPNAGNSYENAATGRLVQNARKEGVDLTAAEVAPNTVSGRTITNLRKAGEVAEDRALNTTNQVTNMIERQTEAARPAGANAASADRIVANDLRTQYSTAKRTAGALYDAVETALVKVPGSDVLTPVSTQQTAAALKTNFPEWATLTNAGKSTSSRLDAIIEGTGPTKSVILQPNGAPMMNPPAASFKEMRTLSKEVGQLLEATRTDPKLAAIHGQLKQLYGAIQADFDTWSMTTVNKPAADAYKAATNFFKENVAPFRDDTTIYRTVSSRTPTAEFDKGAQKITERIIGAGEETTNLATSLMSPKGQEAFRFKLLENARERAINADNATLFSAPGYQREMNLGRTDTPTANRIVMGTNPAALAQAEQTQAIVDATRGAATPKVAPKTGFALMPTANRATNAGVGAGGASLLGLDPTYGAVFGALTAPAVAQGLENILTSRAATDFALGTRYRPGFGLLNPLPGIVVDPRNN